MRGFTTIKVRRPSKTLILVCGLLVSLICCIWNDVSRTQHVFDHYYETIFGQAASNEWSSSCNKNKDESHQHQHQNTSAEYPFTFGACLLIKDDNQILPEWLAYHYTVLPLRYLIVAIDPLSITTPEPILEMFRSIGMGIEIWIGNWYFEDGRWSKQKMKTFDVLNHTEEHALIMRRRRQPSFYTKCLQKFHRLQNDTNITWIGIFDSDEYITYNSLLPVEQETDAFSSSSKKKKNQTFPVRASVPRIMGKQNETIAHYIANTLDKRNIVSNTRQLTNQTLCMVYPRLTFYGMDGTEDILAYSKNTTTESAVSRKNISSNSNGNISSNNICSLPPDFDIRMLHSLRFQYHENVHSTTRAGKSLVNVKNYNGKSKATNPHRPFVTDCTNGVFSNLQLDHPFRFHHYSGSLETFVSRPERTVEDWLRRNTKAGNKILINNKNHDPYTMSEWLNEFIKLVGVSKAYELTQMTREAAFKESMDIKYRVEQLKEHIAPVYEWD